MEKELEKLYDWVSYQYYELSTEIDAKKLMGKIKRLKGKAKMLDEKAWMYDDLNK